MNITPKQKAFLLQLIEQFQPDRSNEKWGCDLLFSSNFSMIRAADIDPVFAAIITQRCTDENNHWREVSMRRLNAVAEAFLSMTMPTDADIDEMDSQQASAWINLFKNGYVCRGLARVYSDLWEKLDLSDAEIAMFREVRITAVHVVDTPPGSSNENELTEEFAQL